MQYVKLNIKPGIYSDVTEYSLPGHFVAGSNFREVNGKPEKIGGTVEEDIYANSNRNTNANIPGVVRDMHLWRDYQGLDRIAIGTSAGIYIIERSILGSTILPTASRTSGNLNNTDYAPAEGFGAGSFGSGLFGQGELAENLTFAPTAWSIDNWGEDLLFNLRGDEIFYWDSSAGGNATAVKDMSGATEVPVRVNVMLVTDPERIVIAGGCSQIDGTSNTSSTGQFDPMFVRCSHQEEFMKWLPTRTNFADGFRLEEGTKIVSMVQTRQEVLVSTDTAIYSLGFTGRTDHTWNVELRGTECGALSKNAMTSVDGQAFWMGRNGFYTYDGSVKEIFCTCKQQVLDEIDMFNAEKVFTAQIDRYNEIWWFYCSNSNEPNKFVMFNHKTGSWWTGDLNRTAWLDATGSRDNPIAFDHDNKLHRHEDGHENIDAWLKTAPMEIGVSSDVFDVSGNDAMHIHTLIPDVEMETTLLIEMEGKMYPEQEVDRESRQFKAFAIQPSDLKKDEARMRARQVAITFWSPEHATGPCRLGTFRLQLSPNGRRG